MWLYGSGFPKSHNIGLDIDKLNGCGDRGHRIAVANRYHPDGTLEPNGEQLEPYETKTEEAHKWKGWGTALKPSYEPIIVARKPLESTVAKNCLKWGAGGINIDECRVKTDEEMKSCKRGSGVFSETANGKITGWNKDDYNGINQYNLGRFPANTILTYDDTDFDEVCGGFPDSKSHQPSKEYKYNSRFDVAKQGKGGNLDFSNSYKDSGSASRYFYCAKASKKDRDEGLDTFNQEKVNDGRQTPIDNAFQRGETLRKNTHPTVKPTELMQYLIRLVTPNNGIILDPFNGSGSTGKAVMYENKERNKNYKYIGIELTEEYLPISKARIEHLIDNVKQEKEEIKKEGQISIFDILK